MIYRKGKQTDPPRLGLAKVSASAFRYEDRNLSTAKYVYAVSTLRIGVSKARDKLSCGRIEFFHEGSSASRRLFNLLFFDEKSVSSSGKRLNNATTVSL